MNSLTDTESGYQLEVWTTEPGMQVYMANWWDGEFPHIVHNAVALECQHYPDSPNQPSFPSTILNPDETYHQTTIFKLKLMNWVLYIWKQTILLQNIINMQQQFTFSTISFSSSYLPLLHSLVVDP